MILSRRERRRRRILSEPCPPDWLEILAGLRHYQLLPERDRDRLRDAVRIFVAEKNWEGGGGLEIDDRIRLTIAAQACLLTLGFDGFLFEGVESIVVYPAAFARPNEVGGSVHDPLGPHAAPIFEDERDPLIGEAHEFGTIVLSWGDAERAGADSEELVNVVLHEFAHVLDMYTGAVDGQPVFLDPSFATEWSETLEDEIELLREEEARGDECGALDLYGASDVSELFAVAVEAFFQMPWDLAAQRIELYELLARWTRQDPASDWEALDAFSRAGRAMRRLDKKDADGALEDAEAAVRLDPEDAVARGVRAAAREAVGDADGAIEDCAEALRIAPDFVEVRLRRARLLADRGELARAVTDLDVAIRLDAKWHELWDERAEIREALGDCAGALSDRARAENLRGSD